MPGFCKMEDIRVWQQARKLVSLIHAIVSRGRFKRSQGLQDQLIRAAISVVSNIAEGFGRGNRQDFLRFLMIAKGSAGEVKTQLYIAHDLGCIDRLAFDEAISLTSQILGMIGSLSHYLRRVKQ